MVLLWVREEKLCKVISGQHIGSAAISTSDVFCDNVYIKCCSKKPQRPKEMHNSLVLGRIFSDASHQAKVAPLKQCGASSKVRTPNCATQYNWYYVTPLPLFPLVLTL